jgi:hypothetical protein
MSNDEKVGYRKPPERSRFKRGKSGNPNGRPKGTKHLKTDLAEELAEQIVVREGEHPMRISKQRAIVKRLVAETVKGDPRMASTLTKMMDRQLDPGDETAPSEEPLNADERDVLRVLRERLARADAMAVEVPAVDLVSTQETTDGEKDPGTDGGGS